MARYNQPRRTWCYTNEFKAKAVQPSYLDSIQIKQVAEALGIHPFMLSRWRKEYREGKMVVDKREKVACLRQEKQKLDKIKEQEAARPNFNVNA